MFSELILVWRNRHVATVAQQVNEFYVRIFGVKKRNQINTPRRLPAPARSASFRFRDVAGERLIKIFFHSRRLPGSQPSILSLRQNERINPKIVKPIQLERVFRRIKICAQIVARLFGDARDHARAGPAGRPDH